MSNNPTCPFCNNSLSLYGLCNNSKNYYCNHHQFEISLYFYKDQLENILYYTENYKYTHYYIKNITTIYSLNDNAKNFMPNNQYIFQFPNPILIPPEKLDQKLFNLYLYK